MKEFALLEKPGGITDDRLLRAVRDSLSGCIRELNKVLLIVPDHTRSHSDAGRIANLYWHLLKGTAQVDLLCALGTHVPMTEAECARMYGDIPFERFIPHNWRKDVVKLGEAPASFVAGVSEGLMDAPIAVEVNRRIVEGGYDLILSVGQVVPHEVAGMANHSKNILVGCGGAAMINASHMLGAFYGMERIMGKDHSPVRRVFDYAAQHFLAGLPISYVLTVTTACTVEQSRQAGRGGDIHLHGVYFGGQRKWFEQAIAQSQAVNLTFVQPLDKVVVYLNPSEFKSTWLGNKSIYRTRMAVADGGELIVLAPGVRSFGEDEEIDRLIRKYGYCGREEIICLCEEHKDLRDNLSAAAHLIHGSSDGRFSITYCTQSLTRQEVEGVRYDWMDYGKSVVQYDLAGMKDGFNTLSSGETVYYISNPALGLWADKRKF